LNSTATSFCLPEEGAQKRGSLQIRLDRQHGYDREGVSGFGRAAHTHVKGDREVPSSGRKPDPNVALIEQYADGFRRKTPLNLSDDVS